MPTIPSLDGYVTNVELSPVAKSGNYNDLSNTPEPVDLTPYATKSELGSKADDDNVVHKSGAETIVGTKTFSGEVQTNTIKAVGGGANISLTAPDNGGFAIRAFNGTTNKEFVGYPSGMLAWDNNEILTRVNGVTVDTEQTISGNKTFTGQIGFLGHNLITVNPTVDLLHGTDNSWAKGGIVCLDKNSVRIGFIDYFIGADSCALKVFCRNRQDVEKEVFYAGINTNGVYGIVDGKNIVRTVNGVAANQAGNVDNQLMLCKNLTGTNIAVGGVVDCGDGNGKLGVCYVGETGAWIVSNTKPTGKWKNTSEILVLVNAISVFVKVG